MVPLAFYATKDGKYTINVLRADGKVKLQDSVEGKTVDITSGTYTFDAEASSEANTSRFTLVFNDATDAVEIEENADVNANANTFDLMGRMTDATQPGIYIKDNMKIVK